jgi:hypothetical protein
MFGSKSILRLLAVLTHHNNGSLYSSKARKDEVEKDEWIWVEWSPNKNDGVCGNPSKEDTDKNNYKFSASAKIRNPVRQAFPKC